MSRSPQPRLGPIQDAGQRLARGFGEFAAQWRRTREEWPDGVAESFEKQHLAEVGPALSRLSTALETFHDDIRAAAKELRDDAQSL